MRSSLGQEPPLPPADLMLRVVPSFDAQHIESARWSFVAGGRNTLRLYEHALSAVPRFRFGGEVWLDDERVGVRRSFADFERLLDFGCGCGRLLRHLGGLADQMEIHGADLDAEMVDWLRANLPLGRYEVASPKPPLSYPDRFFDLVISHSVFTHLDEQLQDEWLRELQRITQPDALLLISIQGQSAWGRTARDGGEEAARWCEELETRGIVFIANDAFIGSTHPDCYHSTIHAPWYVLEHWAEFFDVEALIADGAWSQDLVVLRRRADGAQPSAPPIRHRVEGTGTVGAQRLGRAPQLRVVTRRMRALAGAALRARRPSASRRGADQTDLNELLREIRMLRVGLYEQGKRISVLSSELRAELKAATESKPAD